MREGSEQPAQRCRRLRQTRRRRQWACEEHVSRRVLVLSRSCSSSSHGLLQRPVMLHVVLETRQLLDHSTPLGLLVLVIATLLDRAVDIVNGLRLVPLVTVCLPPARPSPVLAYVPGSRATAGAPFARQRMSCLLSKTGLGLCVPSAKKPAGAEAQRRSSCRMDWQRGEQRARQTAPRLLGNNVRLADPCSMASLCVLSRRLLRIRLRRGTAWRIVGARLVLYLHIGQANF